MSGGRLRRVWGKDFFVIDSSVSLRCIYSSRLVFNRLLDVPSSTSFTKLGIRSSLTVCVCLSTPMNCRGAVAPCAGIAWHHFYRCYFTAREWTVLLLIARLQRFLALVNPKGGPDMLTADTTPSSPRLSASGNTEKTHTNGVLSRPFKLLRCLGSKLPLGR